MCTSQAKTGVLLTLTAAVFLQLNVYTVMRFKRTCTSQEPVFSFACLANRFHVTMHLCSN